MTVDLHPGSADPGCVTVLRTVDSRRLLAKAYTTASNGQVVKRDFPDAKTFSVALRQVDGIDALHRLLLEVERDPRACIIRGAPIAETNLRSTRRQKLENGGAFADVPRGWVMVDADKIPLPAGSSVLADPADVARYLVEMFAGFAPELEDVTCCVQFSSSAGIEEMAEGEIAAGMPQRWAGTYKAGAGVGAHLWFALTEPQDGDALKRWAETINARVGHKAIDPATLRTVQAHYTAGPTFGAGLRDPLAGRRTVLVRGTSAAATLDIPAEAPRSSNRASGARSGFSPGIGFEGLLARIGGADGFNTPIMTAIASYVASRWPLSESEIEDLIERLQQRVREADPGKRSQSEIDRYASASFMREKIAWVVSRQQEKAEAERAEREAADPVEPTFPDQGVSAIEGARRAAEALQGFASKLAAGDRPELLLRITVGGGKSEAAVQSMTDILAAARNGGREGAVYYLVPRHDLGSEIAERIARAQPGQAIAIWRGMDAADPERPGHSMCADLDLPKAAAAAGLKMSDACTACPLREECGYQRQRGQQADIWIAAHNLLFQRKPSGLPEAAALVVDEAFWQAALKGQDGAPPIQLALSALDDTRTGSLDRASAELLIYRRREMFRAIQDHERGSLLRSTFAGFTAAEAKEWGDLEWQTKPKADLRPGMSRDAILDRLRELQGAGFSALRARLAGYIRDLIEGDAARSITVAFDPEADLGRNQGSGPALRFTWRETFAEWAADAPALYLDATTHPDVLRVWAPNLEVVEIEVAAPQQHVQQVVDRREFGRSFFQQNPSNVARLADLAVVDLAEAGDGDVLVIAQEAVEEALEGELKRRFNGTLPPRLHLAHHGALTGLDRWRGVARVIVAGRPALNRDAGERLAEIVKGAPIDRVQDGNRAFWPTCTGGIRRPDGTGTPVIQHCHPDALVEGLRWSITEGAVLQAIGRARGVQRTAPVHVTLLARMALPLTVETVASWEDAQANRLTVAAAEAVLTGRALPLAPADLSAARPDLWETAKSAERFWEEVRVKTPQALIDIIHKGSGGFSGLVLAQYRKPGARRWSKALVPIKAGRAALEALVGPLVAFELIREAAQAEPQHADVQDATREEADPVGARAEPAKGQAAPPDTGVDLDHLPEQPGLLPSTWFAVAPASMPDGLARLPVGLTLRTPPPSEPVDVASDIFDTLGIGEGCLIHAIGAVPPLPGEVPRPLLAETRPQVVPDTPPPDRQQRLAELGRWLDGFPRPPRPWGDGTDPVRLMAWRDRVAAYRPAPAAGDVQAQAAGKA